jgi:hypothetical protein
MAFVQARAPDDREMIRPIAESVAFWASRIDTGVDDANI